MIQVVIGKPGSGKSYHIVRYIVDYISKLAKKQDSRRVIYTNISLNLVNLQKYFDKKNIKIDVNDYVSLLTEDDLRFNPDLLSPDDVKEEKRGFRRYKVIAPGSEAFFWNRFPDDALIILDEVQKFIGSVKEYGESEQQSLVEYFSLHRHKKHDWIFLTQALLSLSLVVRRVTERVQEVFNSKSMTLPFPLSIPFADIQILLRGFGINNQVYRVRDGYLENSYRVIYEGPTEVVPMVQEIFDLYATHTLVKDKDDDSDGVDSELPFDLGPGSSFRAVRWFVGKHWLHLSIKACVIFFIFKAIFVVLGFLADQEKMRSFLKSGINAVASESGLGSSFGSSSGSAVGSSPVNQKKGQDSGSDSPIITSVGVVTVITDNFVMQNGKEVRIGDLVSEGRLVSFSPRGGPVYEDPALSYYRDIVYLWQCGQWLQYVKSESSFDP